MKCNLTDHGIGVSLIMRLPKTMREALGEGGGGIVCDAMVSQIDLFPTLCERLGTEIPAWLRGKSMMPLLRGEALVEVRGRLDKWMHKTDDPGLTGDVPAPPKQFSRR